MQRVLGSGQYSFSATAELLLITPPWFPVSNSVLHEHCETIRVSVEISSGLVNPNSCRPNPKLLLHQVAGQCLHHVKLNFVALAQQVGKTRGVRLT